MQSGFRQLLFLSLCCFFGLVACSGNTIQPGEIRGTFVKATGRMLCSGKPVPNLRLEMWEYDRGGSDLPFDSIDDKMLEGRTDANGRFQLWAAGDDSESHSNPDVYIRALYKDDIPGSGPTGNFTSMVRVLAEGEEGVKSAFRHDATGFQSNVSGDVNFGDIELTNFSGDCAVFTIAREVVEDWHQLMERPFPGGAAQVLRWAASDATHTGYDIVKMGTKYANNADLRDRTDFEDTDPITGMPLVLGSLRYVTYHELGHVIGFVTHSNNTHFADDLSSFFLGRTHGLRDHARNAGYSCNTQRCAEGFAWNEGWGEFWGMRAAIKEPAGNPPPVLNQYAPIVANFAAGEEWEYEGNVRERLRFIASCLGGVTRGYRQMAEVLVKYSDKIPFYIPHSLPEYESYVVAEHPDVAQCLRENKPFCHRQCQFDSECGGSCPFCNSTDPLNPTKRHCGASRQMCERGCKTDADCGGSCPVCQSITNGDVTTSKCVPR